MSKLTATPLANKAGFTLIEVMVTVIVIGIIAAIATPSISLQLANQRIKSTTATLESILKEARSESVIHRMPIRVSYDNSASKSINIEIPYSGPPLYFSSTANFDWTNLFFKSASAYSPPPSGKPSQGNNSQGSQGSNNSQGSQGSNNSQGSQGSNNSQGSQGSNNSQGSQGSNNSQGSQGSNNSQGSQGSNNSQGSQGSNNSQGSQGSNNSQGSQGSNNSQGSQGSNNSQDNSGNDHSSSEGNSDSENSNDVDIEWVIAKNYTYSNKSTITSNPNTIVFKPTKQANHSITYTICDTNKSASPRQVTVSKLGIITSKLGGSC